MYSLNCRGHLLDLSQPVVMGILNATPDSFFKGSRMASVEEALIAAEKMIAEGAVILDIGGASTRPGATEVPEAEELLRTIPVIEAIRAQFPGVIIAIDSWRSAVARAAWAAGAHILNDISAGRFDDQLWETPFMQEGVYVLMHLQGEPATMQQAPRYADVVTEVLDFFIAHTRALKAKGAINLIIDPGFGFGKTVAQNFALLQALPAFERVLDLPVLAGISRKSMICKTLGVSPEHALNGTTALHMAALERGAKILRAHDVKEAVETIRLWQALQQQEVDKW